MKHTAPVTAILVGIFILSQLIGLGLLAIGMEVATDEEGNTILEYDETAIGPRPETTGVGSFIYIVIGVTIGTALLLVLVKFKQFMLWKLWYFLAIWITVLISIGVVLKPWIAAILALILAGWKILKPNLIIYNIVEILIYSGIAVLIVPIFDLFWSSMLLIAISIYDAIAVWKSKHMIKLAKFQTQSKMFAGLMIPYKRTAKMPSAVSKKKTKKTQEKSAILGGGDIAFPLVFIGTILQWLIVGGMSKLAAYGISVIVVVTTAGALTALFLMAKKDRFYPAMPFISVGCFVGLGIVMLIV